MATQVFPWCPTRGVSACGAVVGGSGVSPSCVVKTLVSGPDGFADAESDEFSVTQSVLVRAFPQSPRSASLIAHTRLTFFFNSIRKRVKPRRCRRALSNTSRGAPRLARTEGATPRPRRRGGSEMATMVSPQTETVSQSTRWRLRSCLLYFRRRATPWEPRPRCCSWRASTRRSLPVVPSMGTWTCGTTKTFPRVPTHGTTPAPRRFSTPSPSSSARSWICRRWERICRQPLRPLRVFYPTRHGKKRKTPQARFASYSRKTKPRNTCGAPYCFSRFRCWKEPGVR